MKSKSILRPVAMFLATVMLVMLFSVFTVSVNAFDNSVRDGVVPVVMYLKNASYILYNPYTKQALKEVSLGDTEYSSGTGFFVGKSGKDTFPFQYESRHSHADECHHWIYKADSGEYWQYSQDS